MIDPGLAAASGLFALCFSIVGLAAFVAHVIVRRFWRVCTAITIVVACVLVAFWLMFGFNDLDQRWSSFLLVLWGIVFSLIAAVIAGLISLFIRRHLAS